VVNYFTCTALAKAYDLSIAQFFELNPTLSPLCKEIRPNGRYCVRGCMFCGAYPSVEDQTAQVDSFEVQYDNDREMRAPPNGNLTCIGWSQGQCCNSQTWTCGSSSSVARSHFAFATDETTGRIASWAIAMAAHVEETPCSIHLMGSAGLRMVS